MLPRSLYCRFVQIFNNGSLRAIDPQLLEDHAPSARWRVDTLLSMLGIAGASCDRSIPSAAVVYVSQNEELHAHAAHKTFRMLQVGSGGG